ncbi:hypothetical protein Tco_0988434 [Tanacetum coccineum]|uniref:Integrase, catalytic region, zinc finger, CCHC-type, peptidase aspartic, catalytic n=1 Tax=Tanacetum coccineum TaxID=301880 RepID=A0ABQ5EQZ3_9ASTR
MTGDHSRLRNFMKKFIGTVRFGNDHFGAIIGYGDYVIGDSVISRIPMVLLNLINSDLWRDKFSTPSSFTLLDDQWFNLHKDLLRDALDITPTNDNNPFVAPPLSDIVIEYVNTLGYPCTLRNVSVMIWEEFVQSIHTFPHDRKNLTTASCGKKKTAHLLIPSVRFVGNDSREIFGMPIPDALLADDIKGAPYYNEYLEHVAKYKKL